MKVLIVDDEKIICESLSGDFARMCHEEKYEVFTAQSVREAEEIFYREEPQLVITDINMPHVSGLALVEEIRRHSQDTGLLVLSAYDDFSYVRNAFMLGADDYILKPIAFSDLEEHVRKFAARLAKPADDREKEEKAVFTMEDVLAYIERHIGEKISSGEMAKRMAVSYGQFGKQFKAEIGNSFTGYVLSRRMEKAKEYLANPNVKIKQTAFKVGYGENPQHFSRDFTKYTGLSPKEYRAQLQNNVEKSRKDI